MSNRFALVVRFTLKQGHEESFDNLVNETLPGIHAHEPGTLVYISHAVQGAPSQRMFYELYRDQEAFKAHELQPHVRRFLDRRDEHVSHIDVDFLSQIRTAHADQED